MVDSLTPEARSRHMARIKTRNTKPEMVVRSALHRLGYRFRLHRKDLPGTPDIVLPSRRLALFVHGCFWHGHKSPSCKLGRIPKSRAEFWVPKIEGNRERDRRKASALEDAGWRVATIWECQLADREGLPDRLRRLVENH